jgi:hypothetical protein
MFWAILRTHFRRGWQSRQLRLLAILAVALAAGVVAARVLAPADATHPRELIAYLAKAQLLIGIVSGGCIVGWRLAQLPKSRALEFALVAPGSDWEMIGGEALSAALRTTVVLSAPLPILLLLCGTGWLNATQATAIYAVPIAAGCFTGLGLAVAAYEPAWVRTLMERLLLLVIILYLVCCGLLGATFVPWISQQWAQWQLAGGALSTALAVVAQLNPFRLVDDVANQPTSVSATRVAAVVWLLLTLSAACLCRLVRRLRPHTYDENYSRQSGGRVYQQSVGERPLSWWTARRVSRIKGNINLYLAWATIGLYSSWLVLADRWPPWLATHLLWTIESFGGGALLAVAAVQLAVVPTAFLNGLWDSNEQQRARRLELLLVTPLAAQQYLAASVTAAWCRGRRYVLAALVLWAAALYSGRITATMTLSLCAVALVYFLLSFSVMFRFFARTDSDHDVTLRGLFWSVGLPLLTVALYQAGAWVALAVSPLGAVYLLTLPEAAREQLLGAHVATLTQVVWAAQAFYLTVSVILLRRALVCFDREIRAWFAGHCVSPQARREAKRRRRWTQSRVQLTTSTTV